MGYYSFYLGVGIFVALGARMKMGKKEPFWVYALCVFLWPAVLLFWIGVNSSD